MVNPAAHGSMVREIVKNAAAQKSDLIIFPEYFNVMLATSPWAEIIKSSDSVRKAIRRISETTDGPRSMRDLFIQQSQMIRKHMDNLYGELAKQYGISILAGTYFAHDRAADRLTNRAVLYDAEGTVIYEQDKSFLTAFEKSELQLDAGRPQDARLLDFNGISVGITICRDIFFPVWDDIFMGMDLLIDLRAEGSLWQDSSGSFYSAIPQRLHGSGGSWAVTSTLTGQFIDLFWQGKSAYISKDISKASITSPDTYTIRALAEHYDSEDFLLIQLKKDQHE